MTRKHWPAWMLLAMAALVVYALLYGCAVIS